MTNEEKLKLVAEYMEYPTEKTDIKFSGKREIFVRPIYYKFDSDYQEQIPVWQKVVADAVNIETASIQEFNEWLNIRDSYINQICFGTPLDSFEILVQAIQFLNQIKNK